MATNNHNTLIPVPKKSGGRWAIVAPGESWSVASRSAIKESWVSNLSDRTDDDCDESEIDYRANIEKLSGSYRWQMPSGLPPGNDASPGLFGLAAAYDSYSDLSVRVDAIRRCLLASDLDAKNYLTSELLRRRLDTDWQNELVFLAESQQFYEPELRESLSRRLAQIARENVFERAGSLDVAASAIRTACSMMPQNLADELLFPLLETPIAVDVRPNVFIGIANMFELNPPKQPFTRLSRRVHELAMTFLKPDLMVAGENSAFGQTAVVALAHLADERLVECANVLKGLGVSWYNRAIKRDLAQLQDRWQDHSVEPVTLALKTLSAG